MRRTLDQRLWGKIRSGGVDDCWLWVCGVNTSGYGQILVDVVVFDPDYKLNGTPAVGEMDERYGTDENLTRAERLEKIRLGALECYRVARQRLLVKCMDQVEGGQVRWQTDMVTRAVEDLGGRKIDRFDLIGGGRPQPAGRRQLTAQGRGSTLLVFAKPPTRDSLGQAALL